MTNEEMSWMQHSFQSVQTKMKIVVFYMTQEISGVHYQPCSFSLLKKSQNESLATLAGGCFWGLEKFFSQLPGVKKTQVGYTGGHLKNPTYSEVCLGKTRHAEAVEVLFNFTEVTYESILYFFFSLHNPTTLNRQGNDKGSQYRSAIFYHTPLEQEVAIKIKQNIEKSGTWIHPIVTEIVPAGDFWVAEGDHQNYLKNNPSGYCNHYVRELKI